MLGIAGNARKKTIRLATKEREKVTRWLWIESVDLCVNAAGMQARV